MIKANKYFFKPVIAISKHMKTFDFGEDCLMIQIQTIKNCKTKIFTKTIAYAKLTMDFFENGSWRESRWTAKQFTKLIKPLLAIKANVRDMR